MGTPRRSAGERARALRSSTAPPQPKATGAATTGSPLQQPTRRQHRVSLLARLEPVSQATQSSWPSGRCEAWLQGHQSQDNGPNGLSVYYPADAESLRSAISDEISGLDLESVTGAMSCVYSLHGTDSPDGRARKQEPPGDCHRTQGVSWLSKLASGDGSGHVDGCSAGDSGLLLLSDPFKELSYARLTRAGSSGQEQQQHEGLCSRLSGVVQVASALGQVQLVSDSSAQSGLEGLTSTTHTASATLGAFSLPQLADPTQQRGETQQSASSNAIRPVVGSWIAPGDAAPPSKKKGKKKRSKRKTMRGENDPAAMESACDRPSRKSVSAMQPGADSAASPDSRLAPTGRQTDVDPSLLRTHRAPCKDSAVQQRQDDACKAFKAAKMLHLVETVRSTSAGPQPRSATLAETQNPPPTQKVKVRGWRKLKRKSDGRFGKNVTPSEAELAAATELELATAIRNANGPECAPTSEESKHLSSAASSRIRSSVKLRTCLRGGSPYREGSGSSSINSSISFDSDVGDAAVSCDTEGSFHTAATASPCSVPLTPAERVNDPMALTESGLTTAMAYLFTPRASPEQHHGRADAPGDGATSSPCGTARKRRLADAPRNEAKAPPTSEHSPIGIDNCGDALPLPSRGPDDAHRWTHSRVDIPSARRGGLVPQAADEGCEKVAAGERSRKTGARSRLWRSSSRLSHSLPCSDDSIDSCHTRLRLASASQETVQSPRTRDTSPEAVDAGARIAPCDSCLPTEESALLGALPASCDSEQYKSGERHRDDPQDGSASSVASALSVSSQRGTPTRRQPGKHTRQGKAGGTPVGRRLTSVEPAAAAYLVAARTGTSTLATGLADQDAGDADKLVRFMRTLEWAADTTKRLHGRGYKAQRMLSSGAEAGDECTETRRQVASPAPRQSVQQDRRNSLQLPALAAATVEADEAVASLAMKRPTVTAGSPERRSAVQHGLRSLGDVDRMAWRRQRMFLPDFESVHRHESGDRQRRLDRLAWLDVELFAGSRQQRVADPFRQTPEGPAVTERVWFVHSPALCSMTPTSRDDARATCLRPVQHLPTRAGESISIEASTLPMPRQAGSRVQDFQATDRSLVEDAGAQRGQSTAASASGSGSCSKSPGLGSHGENHQSAVLPHQSQVTEETSDTSSSSGCERHSSCGSSSAFSVTISGMGARENEGRSNSDAVKHLHRHARRTHDAAMWAHEDRRMRSEALSSYPDQVDRVWLYSLESLDGWEKVAIDRFLRTPEQPTPLPTMLEGSSLDLMPVQMAAGDFIPPVLPHIFGRSCDDGIGAGSSRGGSRETGLSNEEMDELDMMIALSYSDHDHYDAPGPRGSSSSKIDGVEPMLLSDAPRHDEGFGCQIVRNAGWTGLPGRGRSPCYTSERADEDCGSISQSTPSLGSSWEMSPPGMLYRNGFEGQSSPAMSHTPSRGAWTPASSTFAHPLEAVSEQQQKQQLEQQPPSHQLNIGLGIEPANAAWPASATSPSLVQHGVETSLNLPPVSVARRLSKSARARWQGSSIQADQALEAVLSAMPPPRHGPGVPATLPVAADPAAARGSHSVGRRNPRSQSAGLARTKAGHAVLPQHRQADVVPTLEELQRFAELSKIEASLLVERESLRSAKKGQKSQNAAGAVASALPAMQQHKRRQPPDVEKASMSAQELSVAEAKLLRGESKDLTKAELVHVLRASRQRIQWLSAHCHASRDGVTQPQYSTSPAASVRIRPTRATEPARSAPSAPAPAHVHPSDTAIGGTHSRRGQSSPPALIHSGRTSLRHPLASKEFVPHSHIVDQRREPSAGWAKGVASGPSDLSGIESRALIALPLRSSQPPRGPGQVWQGGLPGAPAMGEFSSRLVHTDHRTTEPRR